MKRRGRDDTRLATERPQCGGAPRRKSRETPMRRGPSKKEPRPAPVRRGLIEEKDSRWGPDAAGAKRPEGPDAAGPSRDFSVAALFRENTAGPGGGPAVLLF